MNLLIKCLKNPKALTRMLLFFLPIWAPCLAQSVPSTMPPPMPNLTAPAQRQEPHSGARPEPGTIEGFVYWDTSAFSHTPPADLQRTQCHRPQRIAARQFATRHRRHQQFQIRRPGWKLHRLHLCIQ